MGIFRLDLSVDKQSVPLNVVRARVGDVDSLELTVRLKGFYSGESGAKVRFMCKKPNGESVVDCFELESNSASFGYTVPSSAIGVKGEISLAYFSLSQNGSSEIDSTETFMIIVEDGLTPPLPDSYISEIEDIVDQMNVFMSTVSNIDETAQENETARIAAETQRIENEEIRKSAEGLREQNTEKAVIDAYTAVNACNSTITHINDYLKEAEKSTAAADKGARFALEARDAANTAATSASNAATAATTAAQNANEAAQEARDAIENMGSGGGSNIEFVDDATAVQALREMLGGA